MSDEDLGEQTGIYVPEPIEPERTRIIKRMPSEDPTTIFDAEERARAAATVRARGSAQLRVPPIPPRRRAVTPVSLDASYQRAMRLFR